ncbi:MAG: UDP-N-acetylmuramoyl-L-alanyl-D-glutamate--2,6-diaminopimelate ligase, partial [Candidatus Omnitrophica bacterium]|nr:UDP-N-acetylmuramoyl-L-alanyl-D-glutamate--2,6-diaminopimelate ligase [Candidatus Omnitrophota bacterium]
MRLRELIHGIKTQDVSSSWLDFDVQTISCDSREDQKDGLFVALAGVKLNGADFIKDAVSKGARIIVTDNEEGLNLKEDVCVLKVA